MTSSEYECECFIVVVGHYIVFDQGYDKFTYRWWVPRLLVTRRVDGKSLVHD
jgi:hypothetical protein